jgi:hypothetical protein
MLLAGGAALPIRDSGFIPFSAKIESRRPVGRKEGYGWEVDLVVEGVRTKTEKAWKGSES